MMAMDIAIPAIIVSGAIRNTTVGLVSWPKALALREDLKGTLGDEGPRADQKYKCRRAKKR